MVTKLSPTIFSQQHIKEWMQKTAEPHLHVFFGLPNSWFVHAMRWIVWYQPQASHSFKLLLCHVMLVLALSLPWHHSHCTGIPKNCICFKFLVFSFCCYNDTINSLVLLVSSVLLYALTSRKFAQSKKYFIEIAKNSVYLCWNMIVEGQWQWTYNFFTYFVIILEKKVRMATYSNGF